MFILVVGCWLSVVKVADMVFLRSSIVVCCSWSYAMLTHSGLDAGVVGLPWAVIFYNIHSVGSFLG